MGDLQWCFMQTFAGSYLQIGTNSLGKICLINDQKIALCNSRPALSRHFVSPSNIDYENCLCYGYVAVSWVAEKKSSQLLAETPSAPQYN